MPPKDRLLDEINEMDLSQETARHGRQALINLAILAALVALLAVAYLYF